MKHLALDIWDDLRQKRLWPVAAALLVALVAIPLFVMRSAEKPAPAPPSSAATAPGATTPAAVVKDEASGESSDLRVFGRKDPLRPPASTLRRSTTSGETGAGSPAGASATPPSGAGSSGGSGPASAPPVSAGGSGSPGGGSTPAAPRVAPPTARRAYTYVVDLDFGREGKTRLRRGVPRLRALPSERNPVAVFLGVSASGNRAIFLLNAAYDQRGEGTCRPSRATCSFLHLSTDAAKNSHRVADAKGVPYVLRLRAVRRVPVREASRRAARARSSSRGARAPVFADEHR